MTFLQLIKQCPPFHLLPESELHSLKQSLRLQHFHPQTTLLQQGGSPSQQLYLIRRGTVHLIHHGQIADILEVGDMFGQMSLIHQTAPEFSAITQDPCEIYTLALTALKPLLQQYPKFTEGFTYDLTERLRQTLTVESSEINGNLTIEAESLITRPPFSINPTATVGEAARVMRELKIGAVLVSATPPAIVTEQDFKVRVLAEGLGPETLISHIMTQPVKTLPSDTPVYSTMLFMLENGIRRLPLTKHGQIIGVISVTDLLRHQTTNPFFVLSQLDKDPASLPHYTRQVTKIVANLFDGGLNIMQIARTIASMNEHLIKRLLLLTEEQLGPPPTPYTWLVFGSEGRQEQFLLTDQDNALVYQDDTPEAALYFDKFTQIMVNYLIEAGFPPCPGGCMATNWHKPLAQWVTLFRQWIEEPKAQALLEAGIFFDLRAVHGNLALDPLMELLHQAKNHTLFLAHLARAALEFTPPLGFFGRIIKNDQGGINLKKAGIAPIVSLARVYGLQSGCDSPATIDRLESATQASHLSQNGAELLAETFRFLLRLRLKEQLQAHKNGRTPDNNIKWDDLSPLDRRHAKDAFIAIRDYQEHLSLHFNTNRLG